MASPSLTGLEESLELDDDKDELSSFSCDPVARPYFFCCSSFSNQKGSSKYSFADSTGTDFLLFVFIICLCGPDLSCCQQPQPFSRSRVVIDQWRITMEWLRGPLANSKNNLLGHLQLEPAKTIPRACKKQLCRLQGAVPS